MLADRVAALSAARGEATGYARASAALVATIATLSGNGQLAELLDAFAQRIGRYTLLGLATQERRDQSLANWKQATQAIRGNDEDIAEQIHRRLALQNRDAALLELRRRELKLKPMRQRPPGGKKSAATPELVIAGSGRRSA